MSNLNNNQLTKLVNRVLRFTDRNGDVLSRDSSPMHFQLSMEYTSAKICTSFTISSFAQGNGSFQVLVYSINRKKRKLVLNACGNYSGDPYNVQADVYTSGAWEKLVA